MVLSRMAPPVVGLPLIFSGELGGDALSLPPDGGDAAVDGDDRAGEVRTRPRRQEDGGTGHVVGATDALEGRAGGDLLAEGLERRRHHLGLEGTGRDGVDRDGWSQ